MTPLRSVAHAWAHMFGTLVRRHFLFTRTLNCFYSFRELVDGLGCMLGNPFPIPCFTKLLAGILTWYALTVFMSSLREGLTRTRRESSSGGQSSDSVFKGTIVLSTCIGRSTISLMLRVLGTFGCTLQLVATPIRSTESRANVRDLAHPDEHPVPASRA